MSVPVAMFQKTSATSESAATVSAERLDVDAFVDAFPALVDARGGTHSLRRLVLDLARQGRLVPRDPREGTAAALFRFLDVSGAERDATHVPEHWVSMRLSDFADVQAGFAFESERFNENKRGLPLIRIRDIGATETTVYYDGPFRSEFLVHAGDHLIGMDGDFNIREWRGPEALLNQRVCRILYRAEFIDRHFVFHVLQRELDRIHEQTSFTTVKHLSNKQVANIVLPIPPLAEQKRIVAKVDELMRLFDDLEAKQAKKRETQARLRAAALDALASSEARAELEASQRRVIENFSVLFDQPAAIDDLRKVLLDLAVRGALVAREADDGEAPQVATSEETPRRLPDGWRWSTLDALASHVVDCLHATPHYCAAGYAAIRTADVVPGRLLLDQARLVDEEQFQQRVRRLEPMEGDILYTREGERLGIAACVPAGVRLCLSQRMMQIRVREPLVPSFVMWAMNSPLVYAQAVSDTGGSTSPHINIRDVRRFLIPVPPVPQQRRIVAKIEQLMRLCDDLEAKLHRAEDIAIRLVEAAVAQMVA